MCLQYDGFEAGNSSPFSNSSSSSAVTAQVMQSGPLQPYSGDNYLLITFNDSSLTNIRRQATTSMVYNVTQDFTATAGVSYTLSAYAADAQNGASVPDCSLIICGDGNCGAGVPISTTYSQYSYQYTAGFSEAGTVATFSVSCAQSAYVALDNVTVMSNTAGSSSALATTTVTHYHYLYTYITVTLAPLTITSIISVTPPASTLYQTLTATAPTQTLHLTATLPDLTQTLHATSTLSLPVQTQTFTPPANTVFGTLTATLTGPTITETDTWSSSDTSSSTSSSSSIVQEVVPTPTAAGVPAVALAAPTAIAGDPINGAPTSYDDTTFPVSLPVALTLYGQTSSNVLVSSNGVVGLTTLNTMFSNQALPYFGFMDTGALGLWDDLFIYAGTQQGIFYEVDGAAPNRITTFEFYLGHYADTTQYYHFLILFYEARPNVVTFKYLNVSDNGVSATVGVQSSAAGSLYEQYSYNQAIIYPGLQLTFDTTSGGGTYTVDAPGDSSNAATAEVYRTAGLQKEALSGRQKKRRTEK
ncbi:hypothetical protein LTR36_007624 [Oleoguttula mirabilis]|uniref:Uncharacterized protein n=1 Tax=Oleoguttula mirabilis TaxID=1507867 RepID=A0AAV9JTY3_9PEZI|nr:hypothetical protein LTR36_007624 [Oleoguttula mirabilis]